MINGTSLRKWPNMFLYFAKCTVQAFRRCPVATSLAIVLYSLFKMSILLVNYLQAQIVASLDYAPLTQVIVLCLFFCVSLTLYKFRGYITLPVNMIIGHTVTLAYKKDMVRSCSAIPLQELNHADTMVRIEAAGEKSEDLQGDVMMFADALSGLISVGVFCWQLCGYPLGFVYIVFSFAIAIVGKYHSFASTVRQTELEVEQRKLKRMCAYYFELMSGRESGLNVKNDNAYPFFIRKWENLSRKMLHDTCRLKKSSVFRDCVDKVLAEIIYSAALLVLIFLWAKGLYRVENFVFISAALLNLSVMIETLFKMSQIAYQQGAALEPLLELVQNVADTNNTQIPNGDAALSESEVIRMENVCFSYDGTHEVLHDVSFSLKANEVVALVGVNGSGKSTFVQVLLGLFQPNKGRVTHLKSAEASVVLSAAVFQDYIRYQSTLRDNVGFGDVSRMDDDDALLSSLDKAGIRYLAEEMDEGLDGLLGKEYSNNGRELSGGQWQRLAIGRALLGDRQVMVFDEPTAAIDPITEYNQFQEIRHYLSGKSGLLVTHRIGLCRLAHRIVCFEQGKIVEEGTHAQLIARDGVYAHLYRAQAKWYYAQESANVVAVSASAGKEERL